MVALRGSGSRVASRFTIERFPVSSKAAVGVSRNRANTGSSFRGIAVTPSRDAARSQLQGGSRGGTGPLAPHRLAPRRREMAVGRRRARWRNDDLSMGAIQLRRPPAHEGRHAGRPRRAVGSRLQQQRAPRGCSSVRAVVSDKVAAPVSGDSEGFALLGSESCLEVFAGASGVDADCWK